jgi:putative phosphoribosyl transferase
MEEPQVGRVSRETVSLPVPRAVLSADLTVPEGASGVVLFAHGSGSGRMSPRNRMVAEMLRSAGFATLLVDLLTTQEESIDRVTGHLRFQIPFLADRLIACVTWLAQNESTRRMAIGCFGASTGSAAALTAAAELPKTIAAVVSRGGRPDLVPPEILQRVQAPTLLVIGGNDTPVIEMNKAAASYLRCVNKLVIVPGATHLFQEPNALEQVGGLSVGWFQENLRWTPPPQILGAPVS